MNRRDFSRPDHDPEKEREQRLASIKQAGVQEKKDEVARKKAEEEARQRQEYDGDYDDEYDYDNEEDDE